MLGCLIVLAFMALLLMTPLVWRQVVVQRYEARIYTESNAPSRSSAIVFGAAVYRGGRLSTVLRDRMDTAISLYRQGVVGQLLVTGDGASSGYDEPSAMKTYAVQQGVAADDIRVDLGGQRTYDSCYRAQNFFGVQDAILVTQAFHLPRALFVCDRMGIDAVGVSADLRTYRGANWYEFREVAATLVALNDVLWQREPAVTTLVPVLRQTLR
jgi:SanA protein